MTGLEVKVTDLTVRYGDTTALDRLSVAFPPGKIHGLIGRNGSGKSTLLSVLAAFRRATSGTVRVDGEDPFENQGTVRRICLIRETGDIVDGERCRRMLALAGQLRPYWDQEYAEHLAERFRLPLHKWPHRLSLGQRSAFACLLGLASRAPLTMFDESYLGMDAPSRYVFIEEVLSDHAVHPRTIILSTSLVEELESLFEEVVVIDHGRLVVPGETDSPEGPQSSGGLPPAGGAG